MAAHYAHNPLKIFISVRCLLSEKLISKYGHQVTRWRDEEERRPAEMSEHARLLPNTPFPTMGDLHNLQWLIRNAK